MSQQLNGAPERSPPSITQPTSHTCWPSSPQSAGASINFTRIRPEFTGSSSNPLVAPGRAARPSPAAITPCERGRIPARTASPLGNSCAAIPRHGHNLRRPQEMRRTIGAGHADSLSTPPAADAQVFGDRLDLSRAPRSRLSSSGSRTGATRSSVRSAGVVYFWHGRQEDHDL